MGKITINRSHSFSQKVNGFQMSSFLQDLVAYAGQLNVNEKSNDILERFLGIAISTMQVNKVTDYYGSSFAKEEALLPVSIKKTDRSNSKQLTQTASSYFIQILLCCFRTDMVFMWLQIISYR